MLIWFIILLIFMAKGSSDARIKGEGYINFGKAFLMAWLVSIVSMTISSIWQYIFYTFIDPTLLDFQLGQIADYMGGWLERMGAVDKEQFMDEIYTDLELESMSFIDTISGVVCIGNVTLLPAAIIALIYKREDKRPLI